MSVLYYYSIYDLIRSSGIEDWDSHLEKFVYCCQEWIDICWGSCYVVDYVYIYIYDCDYLFIVLVAKLVFFVVLGKLDVVQDLLVC